MKPKKEYYKCLDILRIFSCFAVLLYHLEILKGGCLAVCSFFTLSGYLSCITNFNKENFSLLKYYKNRLIKIYIPIVVTVFTTILATSFFENIAILNLKQEVTSILLGYNNFWQLSANLDYFSKNINSPFMHFWYVAILMQYELIFPFVFILLKKTGDQKSEGIPLAITFMLGMVCVITFYKICMDYGVMNAYYNSFANGFSWLFGISLGFSHCYYKNLMPKIENQKVLKFIFGFHLAILVSMFMFINEKSEVFAAAMSITTIITISLMDYGAMIDNENNKVLKILSMLSYEIYLVQYPVIFIFEHIAIFEFINKIFILKSIFITILILITSFFIHFSLNKIPKSKFLTVLMRIIIIGLTGWGIYKFATAKDYAAEMQRLAEELEANRILMEQRQKEFEQFQENAKAEKENLEDKVKALPIVAYGDSIMLGAMTSLYEYFPRIYIDAKKSRQIWEILDLMKSLVDENKLNEPIIINLGTNGNCSEKTKNAIMEIIGDRQTFWLTVTNDKTVKFNSGIKEYAKKYPNLHIIDWATSAKEHNEYFLADKIHLTKDGQAAYAKFIYENIYNLYLQKLEAETQAKEKELQEKYSLPES